MNSQTFSFHFLLLLLVTTSLVCASISPNRIPRLSTIGPIVGGSRNAAAASRLTIPSYLKTHFYNQTLDHFNYNSESYGTFKQRYLIDSTHWGGSKSVAPIFACLGAESPLERDTNVVGFLHENARDFKALVVYIEHRFQGLSNPVGSMENAMTNTEVRGYFSSVQALADYAEILLYIKKKYSAQYSPVIVIGGSYGGMLASWFRLKYPHIALGALASSAPVLDFDGVTPQDGYYSVVTKDFREVSHNCYKTIRESWTKIERVASKPNGLSILSEKFKSCEPLKDASELTEYLDFLYTGAAQYDAPPRYPVTQVCRGIDGAPEGAGILDKISAGVKSYVGQNATCYYMPDGSSDFTYSGWSWQTCTDMVMPIGVTNEDSMYPKKPYSLSKHVDYCKRTFGVSPRPHWATTYYGGNDVKLVLSKFASNIIFSNGLRDPYSSGGVLEDISDTVLAVTTANGSHCLDILVSKEDDPEWLIKQRQQEVNIIKRWIKKYYHDLRTSRR